MGLIDKFVQKAVDRRMQQVEQAIKNTILGGNIGGAVVYNTNNTEDVVTEGFEGNADVFTCVERDADKFASVPIYEYKIKDKKSYSDYRRLTKQKLISKAGLKKIIDLRTKAFDEVDIESEVFKLLAKPNPLQQQDSFISHLRGCRKLLGEAFIWANTGGIENGKPVELYILPPQHVHIIPNPDNVFDVNGYVVELNGQRKVLRKEDVFHWKNNSYSFNATTLSHLRGYSPFLAGRKELDASNAGATLDMAMKQNKGAFGAVFPKELQLNNEQRDMAQRILDSRVNNNSKAGAVSIFQTEMGYLQFGLTATDLQLVDSRKYNKKQIANLMKMPSILIDDDASSYNNYSTALKQWVYNSISPDWANLRDGLNNWLYPKFGIKDIVLDYDISALPEMQDDLEKLVTSANNAWWKKVDEKRIMTSDEPLGGKIGEMILIPNNLIPIDEASMGEANNDSDVRDYEDRA